MMPFRLTPTVKVLLIAYFVIFILQQTADQFFGGNLLGIFALVPGRFVNDFWVWQIFTYNFLHADVMHLFLNMLMMVFIGSEMEGVWGRIGFLKFFFFSSMFAGCCYLLMQLFITNGLYSPMVGASGGIYGLLIAYGLIFGERTLLFLLMFPMKAKHFIWILAAVEFMTMVFSPTGSKFSAVAHLGGMVGGFLYLWVQATHRIHMRNKAKGVRFGTQKKKKRRKAGHLKLVINQDDPEPGAEDSDGGEKDPKTWH